MKQCRHKFEPRYDLDYSTIVKVISNAGYYAESISPDQRYVCDVCVRCGAIVQRPQ